jgi:serine/threonine-protein kinase HipA
MAQAVSETRALIPGYIADPPEFRDVGEHMMGAWDEGVKGMIDKK